MNENNGTSSHSVLRHVSLVSGMTAISRVIGLLRELVMAYFFGTSAIQSSFVIAFRIPNLFRRLFGEGALGSAFMPVFVEISRERGNDAASKFAANIIGLLVCLLGGISALGILATFLIEPCLSPGSRWLTVLPLMRIMLPYSMFICVAAIISSMLYTKDKFAIGSLTPAVLNVVWVTVLVGICPFLPSEGLTRILVICWGILVAGFLQVAFQLPELKRTGLYFAIRLRGWRESEPVRRVLLRMGPAALGIGLIQINICIDGWLAYYAAEWAPAALEYADRLIYLPLGMFATAFATVLLPTYSKLYVEKNISEIFRTLERALRNLSIIMVPMATGLFVLAIPIISLIYERGEFSAESTIFTARAMSFYAPGLIAFSFYKCVVPIFYAMGDLKTPIRIAAYSVAVNFTLNILSILYLPDGWQHAGMAASTVVSSLINGIILIAILQKKLKSFKFRSILQTVLSTLIISVLLALGLKPAYNFLIGYMTNLPALLLVIATFGICYFPLLRILNPLAVKEMVEDLPMKKLLRKVHLCR